MLRSLLGSCILCIEVTVHVRMYSSRHGKIAITVQRSPFEWRSPFERRLPFTEMTFTVSSHPAGQPFSQQTASDMIGYSLSNDWNAVSGMPAIGKFLPSDRNAVRLAAPDINAVLRRPLIG